MVLLEVIVEVLVRAMRYVLTELTGKPTIGYPPRGQTHVDASQAQAPLAHGIEAEKRSDVKHEYVAGRTYAMVGTSDTHLLADMAAVEDLTDLEDI